MGKKRREPAGPSGLLVVDKPAGLTSHDVVARMRRLAGTQRVGHAGTLDPMATGVLIIGVNKATKLLTWVSGESKTYEATIRLGQSTTTDDADGEVLAAADPQRVQALAAEDIRAAVAQLTGEVSQVPSSYSAIKVQGERSYARARAGQAVELDPREVTVRGFQVHAVEPAQTPEGQPVVDLSVSVDVSSGTYVRALARDLGAALGVGGHLTALRRTSIGAVTLADAATLQELAQLREDGEQLPLLPLEAAADRLFLHRDLSAQEATYASNGRWLPPSGLPLRPRDEPVVKGREGVVPSNRLAAGFAPDGSLVALLQDERRRGELWATPHLVLEAGKSYAEPAPTVPASPEEQTR